jgi:hypothetical protein
MLPERWSLIQLDEELSTDLDVAVRLEREWVAAVAMVPWDSGEAGPARWADLNSIPTSGASVAQSQMNLR